MIVVTGATGHFGKATIEFLLEKGVPASQITAFVRDENKASALKNQGVVIKQGHYDDYASLLAAFQGAEKVLLVSGMDPNREEQHKNAIRAAQETGVKHILYTSVARRNDTDETSLGFIGQSHIGTEKAVQASGIPYTILQNTLYTDGLPMFLGEKVLETGVFFPAGSGKVNFATRADMAEAAANVLTHSGHENKTYVIAGPDAYSFQQVAETLGQVTGKEIAYLSPEPETFNNVLVQAGLPAGLIGITMAFAETIRKGELESQNVDLEKLLGRKPTGLEDTLRGIYLN